MLNRRVPLLLFLTMFVVVGVVADERRLSESVLPSSDPRTRVAQVTRVIPLADGSLFVTARASGFEPHAMKGFLVSDARTIEFRATELLPSEVVQPQTAGQIYAATLLDDGRLAMSIGWTNARSRNINAIAILQPGEGGWKREAVIVMRGSVRDLAAGPENTLVVVATDTARENGQGVLEVLLIDASGGIRSRLQARSLSTEEAERDALQFRLQRVTPRSVALFDVSAGVMRVVEVEPRSTCDASAKRGEDGLLYPKRASRECDSAKLVRLLSLADVPPEARKLQNLTIDALRLHPNGALTVARHGFDGSAPQLVVTRYGAGAGTTVVPFVMARSAVIRDDSLEAVTMTAEAVKKVNVTLGK